MVGYFHLLLHAVHLVAKDASFKAVWAQPRRIVCGHCHDAFVYLAMGEISARASVMRGRGSDETLRAQGRKALEKAVTEATGKPRLGAALCPHCHRYQEWMVRASRFQSVGTCAFVGMLVGALAGWIAAIAIAIKAGKEVLDFEVLLPVDGALLGLGLCGGLAVLFRLVFGLKPGSHVGNEDPASLSEEGWKRLSEEARAQRKDPTRAFFGALDRSPLKPGVTLWPLPFRDLAGEGSN